MKESIQTYLDTNEDLSNTGDQFEEIMESDQKLNKAQAKKFEELKDLVKANDHNFSTYISHNTLPEGYKKIQRELAAILWVPIKFWMNWIKQSMTWLSI